MNSLDDAPGLVRDGGVLINPATSLALVARNSGYDLVRDHGKSGSAVVSADLSPESAREEFYREWLRVVAVKIGMGFHPDTSCDQYEPPLDPILAKDFDACIEEVFGYDWCPYETGMKAWAAAGMIDAADLGLVESPRP